MRAPRIPLHSDSANAPSTVAIDNPRERSAMAARCEVTTILKLSGRSTRTDDSHARTSALPSSNAARTTMIANAGKNAHIK